MIPHQKTAETISGSLTAATIVLCFYVCWNWKDAALEILKQKTPWTAEQWLIIGVFFGFASRFFDNLYWFWPWTAKLLGDPVHIFLMNLGVFINIPVRQLLGSYAAYCHIRSASLYGKKKGASKAAVWAVKAAITYLYIVHVASG